MRLFLILSLFIITPFAQKAEAGEPYACGAPLITDEDADARMPTETGGRCDIHDRRFAYREQALKMQELLKERQENYAAPRRQIEEQYREKLEALNRERSANSDEESFITAEEGFDEAFEELDEMVESE